MFGSVLFVYRYLWYFLSFWDLAKREIYWKNEPADKNSFFNAPDFFDKLSGDRALREAVIAGKSIEEVRSSWLEEHEAYKRMRLKYLLYPWA